MKRHVFSAILFIMGVLVAVLGLLAGVTTTSGLKFVVLGAACVVTGIIFYRRGK